MQAHAGFGAAKLVAVMSFLVAADLGATDAFAQDSAYFLSGQAVPDALTEWSLTGGVVKVGASVTLESVSPFPLPTPRSVERIQDRLWVGTDVGVYRYDLAPLAYVDLVLPGIEARQIRRSEAGAFVQTGQGMIEVNPDGVLLRTIALPERVKDITEVRGGYLLVFEGRVDLYDTSFQFVEEFAPNAQAVAASQGISFSPEGVTRLREGRVAISGIESVAIVGVQGLVDQMVDVGPREWSVHETTDGQLAVLCLDRMRMLGQNTVEAFDGPEIAPGTSVVLSTTKARMVSKDPVRRRCSAGISGFGTFPSLHALGSSEARSASMRIVAVQLPPNVFALSIFGMRTADVPLGNGRLCIDVSGPGIRRGTIARSSTRGSADFELPAKAPGLFVAGAAWQFQVIYRDTLGAGLNGTDAIEVVMR